MRLTVSRSLLSDALRKVQNLAGKSALPILSNVKIEAAGDKVKFTTTDLDISEVVEITCAVLEEGAITLPAKLLSDAIARAAEGDVAISVAPGTSRAVIRAGSSTFKMTGLPAENFPVLPKSEEDATSFSIPQEVMKGLIRRTAYAMSKDDTRRTLKGLHMKFAEGTLTMVGTDGRRLAVTEYTPDPPYEFSMEYTIPEKAIGELSRHLGTSGDVTFSQSKTQMVATFNNEVTLFSKLVDDAYPNYAAVIPQHNNIEIVVDRLALVSAIERVGVFSEENSMKFEIANNEIKLSSATESGNCDEPVPVKYEGEPIAITFNHGYILDTLKALDDDEVKFLFLNGHSPVMIKSSVPGLAVVMPLRVN